MTGGEGPEKKTGQPGSKPRVWAVGGGKGGVGKSVITSSMAITLARQGKRCVLIDADLGGANLHTLFGMVSPTRTLSDLFLREAASLQEILVPTPVSDLWLISGARSLVDMANPAHAQKMKMIRQIFSLEVDHVFIDLGAGSSYNVLDFFLAAHEKIMVVVPTPTSVENAYHFLKAVFYRKFRRAVRRAGAGRIVDRAMEEKVLRGIRSPRDLIAQVAELHPAAGMALYREMNALRPQVLVNQVRKHEEKELARQMAIACEEFFGVEVGCLGSLRHDDHVLDAIQARRPVLELYPDSPFSIAAQNLTQSLLWAKESEVEHRSLQRRVSPAAD